MPVLLAVQRTIYTIFRVLQTHDTNLIYGWLALAHTIELTQTENFVGVDTWLPIYTSVIYSHHILSFFFSLLGIIKCI